MAQFPGFRFARRLCSIPTSGLWLLLALTALPVPAADPHKESAPAQIQPIAPAASTGTGLLLQPPLDLNWYTRAKFVEQSSSIGTNRIGRKWTNPVVPLPPHPRADAKRLT
jgi:hypothetical protein